MSLKTTALYYLCKNILHEYLPAGAFVINIYMRLTSTSIAGIPIAQCFLQHIQFILPWQKKKTGKGNKNK